MIPRTMIRPTIMMELSLLNQRKSLDLSQENVPNARVPKEESHWYRRYLHPDKRSAIERGESVPDASLADKKLAKEFYSTFRVLERL